MSVEEFLNQRRRERLLPNGTIETTYCTMRRGCECLECRGLWSQAGQEKVDKFRNSENILHHSE